VHDLSSDEEVDEENVQVARKRKKKQDKQIKPKEAFINDFFPSAIQGADKDNPPSPAKQAEDQLQPAKQDEEPKDGPIKVRNSWRSGFVKLEEELEAACTEDTNLEDMLNMEDPAFRAIATWELISAVEAEAGHSARDDTADQFMQHMERERSHRKCKHGSPNDTVADVVYSLQGSVSFGGFRTGCARKIRFHDAITQSDRRERSERPCTC
jgi:hypothetical protein